MKFSVLTILIATFLFFPATTFATNLKVPFTPQAPHNNWSQPWQDACEESTIVMVDHFYAGQALDKIKATEKINRILRIKNNTYGWSLDENAEKMKKIIDNFLPWEARIVKNPSIEQIKTEIDNNRPVIALTHGKYLYNPNFRHGGPDYHTVVISGYDDEAKEFITQEPGTHKGQDYKYSYETMMNAIHDFLPGNTKNGDKKVLFTTKEISESKNTDGDKDGLTKQEELKYGTILWLTDSDGDGYSDGNEVKQGYHPTLAESKLPNTSLIKSLNNPKVYLLENNKKRHIPNEQVFLQNGWQWNQIKIVSDIFVSKLKNGSDVK